MTAPALPRSAVRSPAYAGSRRPGPRLVSAREVWHSPWTPAAVALLALPFLRPNALGEAYSPVGLVLLVVAAGMVLSRPSGRTGPRWSLRARGLDPAVALVACLALAYLALVVRETFTRPAAEAQATLQGIVLTVGALTALLVVCRDPEVRLRLARGFVVLMSVMCASYLVSALMWGAIGVGNGQVASVVIGDWGAQPVYFPFTTTVETQPVYGISFPRFSGLGREPGWMAMYCAATFFMARMAGIRSRLVKPLMLVGLLGCVSTAGFGVFVVTWAYHRFLRDRGAISLANYCRQLFGLAATAAAIWIAVDAPVLGLSAKSTQNATSLDDRTAAIESGLRALTTDPWGGMPVEAQAGINMISDIAVAGLPFVLLVILGIALSTRSTGGGRFSNAVALAVFATLLLSQPAKDSTWAFGLVLLAATLRRPDMPPDRPPPPSGGPP